MPFAANDQTILPSCHISFLENVDTCSFLSLRKYPIVDKYALK